MQHIVYHNFSCRVKQFADILNEYYQTPTVHAVGGTCVNQFKNMASCIIKMYEV